MSKALPNRTNIILSNSDDFFASDAVTVKSLGHAIDIAQNALGGDDIFVIGGAQTYRATLPYASRLMITMVDAEFPSDAYFPEIDMQKWHVESEQLAQNEKDQFPLHFIVLVRKTTP